MGFDFLLMQICDFSILLSRYFGKDFQEVSFSSTNKNLINDINPDNTGVKIIIITAAVIPQINVPV